MPQMWLKSEVMLNEIHFLKRKKNCPIEARQWWCTPLIPAVWRQRQVDLCEFEVSLIYRASSSTGSKATEKPCLGKKNVLIEEHHVQSCSIIPKWRFYGTCELYCGFEAT